MLKGDFELQSSHLQSLSNRDEVVKLFTMLGYHTDVRLTQTTEAMGLTADGLKHEILHIELIANEENGALQVYLAELRSVTVANTQALARALKNRGTNFLFVLTSDYDRIDFVLFELTLPIGSAKTSIGFKGAYLRPRVLTVHRQNPGEIARRVLRRFSYTEVDAYYQFDKLRSAYNIADWTEEYFNNRALFSDYYLNNRLKDQPEWRENPTQVLTTFEALFDSVREKLSNQPESAARTSLFEPAFRELGFSAQPRKNSSTNETEPDYLLFALDDPSKPLAYCSTYVWDRTLDGRDETRDSETPDENPGAMVVSLLDREDGPEWAIVTNGKTWRLYSARAHSRATNYYEIDLEEALASPDYGHAFKYFWLLFRASAFIQADGQSFLSKLLDESERYAKELEERLKDRAFEQIFPKFAEGFIADIRSREGSSASLDQDRLDEVFQGTLTFLYRLLFLLYAEARDLLPVREERGYRQISLQSLSAEVARTSGSVEDQAPDKIKKDYSPRSTELYDRLSELFGVIDQGGPAFNVPLYNGGLFSTQPANDDTTPEAASARFLAEHRIPDRYLALGLDLLARDVDAKTQALAFIDYKSLGVRQLGSVYEGLLEFKLRVAPEPMAVIKGKKTDEVIPERELATGKRVKERLPKGAVYLENDKRERKASGSYYTPDYIVKYIVQNTVGPVLEEKLEALRPKLREAQLSYRQAQDRQKAFQKQGMKGDDPEKVANTYRHLVDELFDVRVLDPAMGSGHFLVEVVDFVTDKMLKFLNAFPWNPVASELRRTRESILGEMENQRVTIDPARLTDINLLKRHVLKRCIYGVDLNPMAVELAKLSLWLDSFTLGAPLSFLDHHLKCGNSLIGVWDVESYIAPGSSRWHDFMRTLAAIVQVSKLTDSTVGEIKESTRLFEESQRWLTPTKQRLNVALAASFLDIGVIGRIMDIAYIQLEERISQEQGTVEKFDHSQQIAQRKRFFHWKLEFPEVFLSPEKQDWKTNQGFDVIVGNPPWASVRGKHASGLFDERDVTFLEKRYPENTYMPNAYEYFIAVALRFLGDRGRHSFIVPDRLGFNAYLEYLRQRMLANYSIVSLIYKMPFPDVIVDTLVYCVSREPPGHHSKVNVAHHGHEMVQVPVTFYEEAGDTAFLFFDDRRTFETLERIDEGLAKPLSTFAMTTSGFGGKGSEITENRKSNLQIPVIKGADIGRYGLLGNHYFEFSDDNLTGRTRDTNKLSYVPKVLLRKTGDPLFAAYDSSGTYPEQSAYFLYEFALNISPLFLLTMLNSRVFGFYYSNKLVTNRDSTPQIKKIHLDKFPCRYISFGTTPDHRTAMAEKGRQLYARCLSEGSHQCVLDFVEHHLSQQPEEADVVHDLLAHLAESMIDLNKQKQSEQKRFLSWLEATLQIRPDKEGNATLSSLKGKSKLFNYLGDYQKRNPELPYDDIAGVLHDNRTRIGVSLIDPHISTRLQEQYAATLQKLRPIKSHLALTDSLIDQVVYKLYGLTEDEIAIVEGTIVSRDQSLEVRGAPNG